MGSFGNILSGVLGGISNPIGGIASLFSGLLGGAAGAANTRPPALNSAQSNALNGLLAPGSNLMQTATGTPTIDPVQQALMFGQNAQSLTGANNQATHALVSRGLGRSGLLGQALMQNANQSQVNQGNINLGLQQQAVQQRQLSLQDILGLLNVNTTPGQSKTGGFLAGMAPVAAYSLQSLLNNPIQAQQPGTTAATLPTVANANVGELPLPSAGLNTPFLYPAAPSNP